MKKYILLLIVAATMASCNKRNDLQGSYVLTSSYKESGDGGAPIYLLLRCDIRESDLTMSMYENLAPMNRSYRVKGDKMYVDGISYSPLNIESFQDGILVLEKDGNYNEYTRK